MNAPRGVTLTNMTLEYQRAGAPKSKDLGYEVLGGFVVAGGVFFLLLALVLFMFETSKDGGSLFSNEVGWRSTTMPIITVVLPLVTGVGLTVLGAGMVRSRAWALQWCAAAAWVVAVALVPMAFYAALQLGELFVWRGSFGGRWREAIQFGIMRLSVVVTVATFSGLVGYGLHSEKLHQSLSQPGDEPLIFSRTRVVRLGLGIWSIYALTWFLVMRVVPPEDGKQHLGVLLYALTSAFLAVSATVALLGRASMALWIWTTWALMSAAMLWAGWESSRDAIDVIGTYFAVVWYLAIAWWITRLLRKEHVLSVRRDLGSELC